MTYRIGENETEIEFVLIKKEHQRFVRNVGAISGEFQHALVIADRDTKKMSKVVKKTCAERRNISLPEDVKIRKRIEEKANKLDDGGAPN